MTTGGNVKLTKWKNDYNKDHVRLVNAYSCMYVAACTQLFDQVQGIVITLTLIQISTSYYAAVEEGR